MKGNVELIAPIWIWRFKLLLGAFIGFLLAFLYTTESIYPKFYPPKSVHEGQTYVGVAEKKGGKKWYKNRYRIRTDQGIVTWGCGPNTDIAATCPAHEVWKPLEGKKIEVVLLSTKGAKSQENVMLTLKYDNMTIIGFDESSKRLTKYVQSSTSRWPIYASFIGSLFGMIIVMHFYSNFSFKIFPTKK